MATKRRRATIVGLITVLGLVGVGLLVWRFNRQPPVPAVANSAARIDQTDVEPAIRRVIEEAAARVQADPNSADRRAELAMVFHANGLPMPAMQEYQQALAMEKRPQRKAVLSSMLAAVHADVGETGAALRMIDVSIANDATYAPSHWQRGFWLLDVDRLNEAEASFRTAQQLDSSAMAAQVGLARVCIRRGEYQQAVDMLQRMLEQPGPNEPHVRHLLAGAQRMLGRGGDDSHDPYQPATTAAAWDNPWLNELTQWRAGYRATIELANALISSGRYAQAIPHIENALRQRPGDVTALNYSCVALMATGQNEAGIAALHQALATDPDSPMTHLRLSQIYERADPSKCLSHAQHAVRANPNSGYLHRQLGRAYALANRPADAAAALTDAVNHGAHDWETRLLLGRMLMESGQPAPAERVLRQALASEPDSASVCAAMARSTGEQGRLDEAAKWLEDAQRLNPNEPAIPFVAARLRQLQTAPPNVDRPASPGVSSP